MKEPQVLAIYTAPVAGEPMVDVQSAELTEVGIKGDRYESGNGAYSKNVPRKIRHISLITAAGIATANEWLSAGDDPTLTAIQTRRNIVIDGMSPDALNDLVGRKFQLGSVLLKGIELCTPCQRPAQLVNKSDFINAFEGRGGLRAEIIVTGTISVGDHLYPGSENS